MGNFIKEVIVQICSVKVVLKNFAKFTEKYLCQSLFLINLRQSCIFIEKETLAKMFSCEFCEIFKNIFFYKTPLVAASVASTLKLTSL